MKPSVVFMFMVVMCATATGETPVSFADANLKAAVEAELGISDPTPTDMKALTTLMADHQGISSLSGLDYAVNLTYLSLYDNHISQLSPLANLTKLTFLDVDDNHISDLMPLAGLTQLRHLDLDDNQITNLSALSGLSGLRSLYLEDNQISDISPLANLRLGTLSLEDDYVKDLSPLAGMTSLRYLYCESNGIRDISSLSALTQLQHLDAHDNLISDVSVLSNLVRLRDVYLHQNRITCIQPLVELTNLNQLDLSLNPLNRSAYTRYLSQIADNNPGLNLNYDEDPLVPFDADPCEPGLILSSTVGGTVTLPQEKTFFTCPGETVAVEAKVASNLFVFAGWTGTAVNKGKVADPNLSSTFVTVDEAYTLRAHFESILDTLVVDPTGDPNGDGTPEHPLAGIQDAIDAAGQGARIIIRPAIYRETLIFNDRSVTITGTVTSPVPIRIVS